MAKVQSSSKFIARLKTLDLKFLSLFTCYGCESEQVQALSDGLFYVGGRRLNSGLFLEVKSFLVFDLKSGLDFCNWLLCRSVDTKKSSMVVL